MPGLAYFLDVGKLYLTFLPKLPLISTLPRACLVMLTLCLPQGSGATHLSDISPFVTGTMLLLCTGYCSLCKPIRILQHGHTYCSSSGQSSAQQPAAIPPPHAPSLSPCAWATSPGHDGVVLHVGVHFPCCTASSKRGGGRVSVCRVAWYTQRPLSGNDAQLVQGNLSHGLTE